jgi:hypothetical protein
MEQMVQGQGAQATSFPPALTTSISSVDMLSRMNLSCGSHRNARSLRVVSSTIAESKDHALEERIGPDEDQAGRLVQLDNLLTRGVDSGYSFHFLIWMIQGKKVQPVGDIGLGSRRIQKICVGSHGRLSELEPAGETGKDLLEGSV